jgi:hypothetical protein
VNAPRNALSSREIAILQGIAGVVADRDKTLAAELSAGAVSAQSLDLVEAILADLLVETGFDARWEHNEVGRNLEELLSLLIDLRVSRGW